MVSSFYFKPPLSTPNANCDADAKHLVITICGALAHVETVGDVSDAQFSIDMFNAPIEKVDLPCLHGAGIVSELKMN